MSEGRDPYCYPETAVLRNHYGIQDAATLAAVEADLTAVSIQPVRQERVVGGCGQSWR